MLTINAKSMHPSMAFGSVNSWKSGPRRKYNDYTAYHSDRNSDLWN
jgi:hypothetical protein